MRRNHRSVIYLGFNDPRRHVRGTENVIRAQSEAAPGLCYYVFRGPSFAVFRWQGLIAIACPNNLLLAGLFLARLAHRIAARRGQRPIIHAHSYLLATVAPRGPILFTVHDGLTYLQRHFGRRSLWPYRLMELWVYFRARKIHAISRYAWSEVVGSTLFRGKLAIVFNCLPDQPRAEAAAHATADVPTRDSEVEYLIVRSIEPRANLDLVIELARYLQSERPEASIVVAGKGPQLEHFRERVANERLGNLRFLGYVSDAVLDVLYRRANCVIMPALYGEGFGLPLIEAYSRGIPAVASAVCAVPEVIQSQALMFQHSVPSLLSALRAADAIPTREFLHHFDSKFSRREILAQYRLLYDSIK